jgi:tripartite-type tricarboxylate transporter receptor subunit TctC
MMPKTFGRRPLLAGLLGGPAMPALARAAMRYPDRPVRVIVPFGPGGASDFVARILQPRLGEVLGQPLVIENRAGAAGNIGMEAAARSAPDGYTLFLGNVGTLAINPTVFSRALKVKPATDFAPVTLVADTPDILVVGPSLPVRTVKEFVAEAKAKPGALSYASPGSGSLNRLEMELLRQAEGLDMIHVPYTAGAGQAATDILGGAVAGGFITLSSALGHVQGGRMKGLAVTTARRIPALPDVPTMEESGYPGFVSGSWQGLLAPAGTPPEIIERLHAVTAEALRHPDVVRRYATGGVEPVSSRTPDEFADFMAREARRWGEVAERSGAAAD